MANLIALVCAGLYSGVSADYTESILDRQLPGYQEVQRKHPEGQQTPGVTR